MPRELRLDLKRIEMLSPLDEFKILESKITVLEVFALHLRKNVDPKCQRLAEAVERVLKSCGAEEIEKAFEMVKSKHGTEEAWEEKL